jgi:hypothetical protein
MNIVDEVRARYGEMRPALILASTLFCGAGALRRTINLGRGALIYGENRLFVESLSKLLGGKLVNVGGEEAFALSLHEEVLMGEGDAETPSVDYDAYCRTLLSCFYQIAAFYRDQAARAGVPHWGLVHRPRDFAALENFTLLVPEYRSVTLYRNVVAVAREVRARWPRMLSTPAQCRSFGARWRDRVRRLLSLGGERTLPVAHESLAAGSRADLGRIERHLGFTLDQEAVRGMLQAQAPKSVPGRRARRIPPPPRGMTRLLIEGAEPLYSELGYGRSAPDT